MILFRKKGSYIIFIISIILIQVFFLSNMHAQITLDGTFGQAGLIPGPDHVITDAMGKQVGANLFHSFGEFNVRRGESATFTGKSSVQNIISRVTGGNASWINGIIRSKILSADLFLINPSGMMFGPNALLDISGSFYVSTSDYIRLGESGRFDATQPEQSVLSVAQPSAFGFLEDNPAKISVKGSFLEVSEGESLCLAGGDINMKASMIYTENGQINIASVASNGEAMLSESGIDVESFSDLGKIQLSQDSYISIAGNVEGGIMIQGGQFFVKDSCISSIVEGDEGEGRVDISLRDDLRVTEGGEITSYGIGEGKGRDIIIEAENLALKDEGTINSASRGNARCGDIEISAKDSITISGSNDIASGVYMWSEGEGDAGSLSISCNDLNIKDDGIISGSTYAEGSGPDISVDIENLKLSGGGNIDNSCYGSGSGGDLTVRAQGSVNISGKGGYKSGIYALAYGSGDAGSIAISGMDLHVNNEGIIAGGSFEDADGRGADINIDVKSLKISQGGEISVKSYGSGQGGDISINAGDSIVISGSTGESFSSIKAEAHGAGDSGIIMLSTPDLIIEDKGIISGISEANGHGSDIWLDVASLEIIDGYISSSSLEGSSGDGGNINVSASESVLISHLKDEEPSVFGLFSMTGGSGNAGNISISTLQLIIKNGGQIEASTAFGKGMAGNISLDVECLELTGNGMINSSSNDSTGQGGKVRIHATDSILISDSRITALTGADGDAGQIELTAATLNIDKGGMVQTLTGENSTGCAGDILLELKNMEIMDGGMLNSSTLGSGQGGKISVFGSESISIAGKSGEDTHTGLYSLSSSSGNAGKILVSVPSLSLTGPGSCIMASTIGSGLGGDIQIFTDRFQINSGSYILADSSGKGNAGNIYINAKDAIFCKKSSINTEAEIADGGNIHISAKRMINLIDSRITATVRGGIGNGGNIEIDPMFVILDNSAIVANAEEGNGGNIRIVSQIFLSSTNSIINASSRLGIDGIVDIDAPLLDISSHLIPLPGTFQDLDEFFPKSCVQRDEDEKSNFILKEMGGLPPKPDSLLLSP